MSESTIFSMDLRTPSEKAGNDARQGKMRMKVYFKKGEKGGKWLHVRIEITQTKRLNGLKQDHMHFVTSVVILYTPQPPPYVSFLLPLPPSNMATLSLVL